MLRIFALLVDLILTIVAIRYAVIAQSPLFEMLIGIAFLSFMNFMLIVWGKQLSSKLMRFVRPSATVGNFGLLVLLLPISFIILSLSETRGDFTSLDDIVVVSGSVAFVLLTIGLNLTYVRQL